MPDMGQADRSGYQAATAFLLASPQERPALAPILVDRLGESRINDLLTRAEAGIGPFQLVVDRPGGPILQGTRGEARIWAHTDASGHLDGLMLGAAHRTRHARTRPRPNPMAALTVAAVVYAVAVASCWFASSVGSLAGRAAFVGVFVLLVMEFDLPSRSWLNRPARICVGLTAAAAIVSAVRLPHLRSGGWDTADRCDLALFGVAVLCAVVNRWKLPAPSVTVQVPVRRGRWFVAAGGSRLGNHHLPVAAQRGALDLVALGPSGARVSTLGAKRLQDYIAYGQPVFAPCDGTVVAAVDQFADQPIGHPIFGPPAGNQIRIAVQGDCVRGAGVAGFTIVLAHLRPGSLRVAVGDSVRAGDVLGQVGNSGRTFEPHLHLHAERDGYGLRLQFEGLRRRPRRGRVVGSSPHRS